MSFTMPNKQIPAPFRLPYWNILILTAVVFVTTIIINHLVMFATVPLVWTKVGAVLIAILWLALILIAQEQSSEMRRSIVSQPFFTLAMVGVMLLFLFAFGPALR